MLSSTRGWRSWNSATAGGTSVAPALWKHGSRGLPPLEPLQPGPAAAQPADRGQLLLGRLDAGEDRVRVGYERAAGLGEPHAARAALHELRPGLALERGHVLADRRLCEVERLRRGGERAPRRDLPEHAHPLDIEH